MKKFCFFSVLLLAISSTLEVHAQFGKLKEKIKQKVEQRVDRKTDQAIDKTLDETEKTVAGKDENDNNSSDNNSTTSNKTASGGLKSYSKFDFVPGDKIVYAEDFSQDVVGEFPLKWNTKGSGEIVTIDGMQGKWLQMQKSTLYVSPLKTKFPENATVEFDLLVDFKSDQRVPYIAMQLYSPKGIMDAGEIAKLYSGAKITFYPNGGNATEADAADMETYDAKGKVFFASDTRNTNNSFTNFNKKQTPVHVACWIQKQRVRVWLNEKKVYDLPRALAPDAEISQLRFDIGSYGGPSENFQYYVSNIKVAVAAPDTRSKLKTEGRWSTTGILFDVNSDKIKPSSYGVLKEIASVLSENAEVKVKIIGHTDSDGDDAKNLDLSKRRAAAVKAMLASEFSINASRLTTDGMGETKPVGDNKTSEGKAQNRRVEFLKL